MTKIRTSHISIFLIKIRFVGQISNFFGPNFRFLAKFDFWHENSIFFDRNSIFLSNKFWPKIDFVANFQFLSQHFNFWQKFELFGHILYINTCQICEFHVISVANNPFRIILYRLIFLPTTTSKSMGDKKLIKD